MHSFLLKGGKMPDYPISLPRKACSLMWGFMFERLVLKTPVGFSNGDTKSRLFQRYAFHIQSELIFG